jgi:hypothetical protein
VILQLGTTSTGRAVVAPAVEADEALPPATTVPAEGG